MRRAPVHALVLCCAIAGASSARADEVWLLSGNTLTGTAQTLERGVLTFRTPYADAKVPWKDVAALETARHVRVTVRQQGSHVGRLKAGPLGYLRLETLSGASLDVALSDIVMIVRAQSGVIATGRAQTGFLVSSGTNNLSSLYFTGELAWRTPVQRTAAEVAINRNASRGLETARNVTATFRHQEFLTDRIYANANAIFTNDRFRDLTLRTAPGAGIGYQFLRYGVTTLSFDGGIGYVDERHEIGRNRHYWAVREAAKFEAFIFPKRLEFFHQNDGYFGLDSDENWFMRTRSGLRVTVASGIIVTGELGVNYDRQATPRANRIERTFAITMGYQRGY
jgi:putative salt-induced outer membrane protein YdiY